MENFNGIDYIIAAICIVSMLAGFIRGFLKEAISLGSWVVAALVATKFSSPLAATFSGASNAAAQSAFGNSSLGATAVQSLSVLSIIVSFIVLFMGTLLIGTIIGYMASSVATGTGLGLFNRLFGIVFGGLRGYVIAVVLIFVLQMTPMGMQPSGALSQSQLVPQLQPAVQWFGNIASPEIQAIETQARTVIQSVGSQLPNPSSLLHGFSK